MGVKTKMKKCWEYLGLKKTSWNPYGNRKYNQYSIIAKTRVEKGLGKFETKYLLQIQHDYTQYKKESWKTLKQLKSSLRKLDTLTELGEKYLKKVV